MSATRLLVLGVVRGYGRAHGYLIGNDLLAWGADQWANVKWGSIYHALKQLTKSGSLIEDFLATRTEYELTERGELEFQKLLRNAIRRPEHRPDMLGAGLALLPALTRQDAVALLRERLAALEAQRDDAQVQLRKSQGPEHVWELYTLWGHSAESSIDWTQGLLTRLEQGSYAMAGEPGSPGKPGSWHDLKAQLDQL
ncbi:PadR family transcriptional regulator [Kibdelosporangium persicum]|uniref:Transcriptional regulator n=1 Tax=Kibdelosporangium persicum TaxID=2698649 RepID=A0ABX2F3B2_9PSEU|nr:helix-turn-helix transcriptional regulator [Kibdelosporangium persicum]NRN65353.1 Transcriptional regulator [Kibdelosporangium persicum]